MSQATPKDVNLLSSGAGVAESTGSYLQQLAPQFDDVAVQQPVDQLAQLIHEESNHLRHIARQKIQILKENADKDSGASEDVSNDFLYAVYDQRMLLERGPDNIKWYNPFTDLGDITGRTRLTIKKKIMAHHSAVHGGFGVHKWRVKDWTKQGNLWLQGDPEKLWHPSVVQFDGSEVEAQWLVRPQPKFLGDTDEEQIARWARAMALADRYRGYKPADYNNGVPYHVVSAANSILYYNLPWTWVTWHGNGGNNDCLGLAWDANSTKDTFRWDDMEADLKRVAEDGRAEGHFVDGLELTMHCCYTNKPHDAGKEYAEFLMDIAPRLDATVDLDFKARPEYTSFREVLQLAA